MNHNPKYRNLVFLTLTLFLLSSVGIPVVLASCPLSMTASQMSCCPAEQSDGTTSLNPLQDYYCCATILVAERNTTVFVKLSEQTASVDLSLICEIYPVETAGNSHALILGTRSPSPPHNGDIPIFVSSLLI